jgi:hypothetical protein
MVTNRIGSPARWRVRSCSMSAIAASMSLEGKDVARGTVPSPSISTQYTMNMLVSPWF